MNVSEKIAYFLAENLIFFLNDDTLLHTLMEHVFSSVKETTSPLPTVYLVRNTIVIVRKTFKRPDRPFVIEKGFLIGKGREGAVFSLGNEAVKLPCFDRKECKEETALHVLRQEERILTTVHASRPIVGIQKPVALRAVKEIVPIGVDPFGLSSKEKFTLPYLVKGPLYRENLEGWVCRRRSDPDYSSASKHLLSDLAQGLKILHDRNIVHGDIKQRNILCLEDNPFFADFGYGELLSESDPLREFSFPLCCALACTRLEDLRNYNSLARDLSEAIRSGQRPDAIRRLKDSCLRLRKQIDVFQSGVVFYQILIGNTTLTPYPFYEERGPGEIRPEEIRGTLRSKSIPESSIALLLRMLDSDPEKRPSGEEIERHFRIEKNENLS